MGCAQLGNRSRFQLSKLSKFFASKATKGRAVVKNTKTEDHGDRFLNEFTEFIQKPVPMISLFPLWSVILSFLAKTCKAVYCQKRPIPSTKVGFRA